MYFLLTLPSKTPILCLQRPLLRDATLIHRLSWELYIHTSLLLIRPPKKNKEQRTNVTNILRLFSFVFIDSFKSSKCDVNGQHVHVKVTFNQLTVLSDFHLNFKHTPYLSFFFSLHAHTNKKVGFKRHSCTHTWFIFLYVQVLSKPTAFVPSVHTRTQCTHKHHTPDLFAANRETTRWQFGLLSLGKHREKL